MAMIIFIVYEIIREGGGGGVLICVNSDLTCKFLPHKSVVVEGLLETITI